MFVMALRHRGVARSEDKLISGRIKHNTDTDTDTDSDYYYHC